MKSNTDTVIEHLVDATLSDKAEHRSKHLLREALRGLVRLAKSEQMLEIKTSVNKLTGVLPRIEALRKGKPQDAQQEKQGGKQNQLEFNQNSPVRNRDGSV